MTQRKNLSPQSTRLWVSEVIAGSVGTLSILAVPLTLGLLAFSALGADGAAKGIAAGLFTAVGGGVSYALAGRAALPVAGPSSATALILAGLVAQLARDPAFQVAVQPSAALILAMCGIAVSLGGVLQIAMALAGMARLVRFVPQPVLAGFMNGVALLILLSQLPPLLGLPLHSGIAPGLTGLQWRALALGLATAVTVLFCARRWPQFPAALVVLLAGTVAYTGMGMSIPSIAMGSQVGAVPIGMPWPNATGPLWQTAGLSLLASHWSSVVGTAAVLALIGALESALNTLAVDQLRNTRHDPRRELMAIGLTNVVLGAFGALSAVALRARANAILKAGGTGPVAAIGGSVTLGLLVLLWGQWLALLPLAVLAGIMLTVGLNMLDQWTRKLIGQWWAGARSRDMHLSLGTVALVCVATVWQGFPVAVALGVLLSMAVFIDRMNRSLVRARYTAAARPSLRIYPEVHEATLRSRRDGIVIFELEGALFFGSGERLLNEVDALPMGCCCLVLDLHRLRTIDETGAMSLQQIAAQLKSRGVVLHLAGLAQASELAGTLRSFGLTENGWPDADRAIEAAEQSLLVVAGVATLQSVPLAACTLLHGLDAGQLDAVLPHLQAQTLQAGEVLFHAGAKGDRLYLLVEGSVSVVSTADVNGTPQRFVSISPGMLFGETAIFDAGGRTAAVVADLPAVVYALTLQSLETLDRAYPALGSRLYRNIALHLSQRLRNTTAAWSAAVR